MLKENNLLVVWPAVVQRIKLQNKFHPISVDMDDEGYEPFVKDKNNGEYWRSCCDLSQHSSIFDKIFHLNIRDGSFNFRFHFV